MHAPCQISVWTLEADTTARLWAEVRAEYQCGATVSAGKICPFETERREKDGMERGR